VVWRSRPLTKEELDTQTGLPAPEFLPGEVVESIVGSFGDLVVQTQVIGPVASYTWHWKRGTWIYKLVVPGRRRSRWYLEAKLRRTHTPAQNANQALQ
jgi:hypothetical protein